MKRVVAGWLAVMIGAALPAAAQDGADLNDRILELDSIVFERGFNACDLQAMADVTSDDFTFFHDLAGADYSKDAFLGKVRDNICNGGPAKPSRKLIPNTVEVHPLYQDGELYGALQTGEHAFYLSENGGPAVLTNIARFSHLWLIEDGNWKLKSVVSYDHTDPRANGPFDADILTELFTTDRRTLDMLAIQNISSLGVGYIQDGKLQQVRVFGELDDGVPAPIDAIYNVASLAKTVTALLTLKLADAGLLDLDAPLSDYYTDPELAGSPWLEDLTARNVLSHRSGLPNWRYLRDDRKLTFEFRPGEKFQYSGEGIEILRKALEAKFSKPFETLAETYVFEPLQMHDTSYVWDARIDDARVAIRHDADGAAMTVEKHTEANAAANLMTTVGDYGKFLAYVSQGAGLSPALYQEMLTTYAFQKDGIGWGLGWSLFPDLPARGLAIQHTGGDDGIKALAVAFPETGEGLVVFSNSENGLSVWKKMLHEYFGADGDEITRRNLADSAD